MAGVLIRISPSTMARYTSATRRGGEESAEVAGVMTTVVMPRAASRPALLGHRLDTQGDSGGGASLGREKTRG